MKKARFLKGCPYSISVPCVQPSAQPSAQAYLFDSTCIIIGL